MNCALGLVLLAAGLLAMQTTPVAKAKQSKPAPTKPAAGAANNGTPRASKRRGRARAKRAAPSYPSHPEPERYRQIQQALADRGYFKGEANGQWGEDSVDALRRFQTDQKLENDGKINALTLTGLGLGPKHEGSSAPAPSTPGAASTPGTTAPPTPASNAPDAETPPH